MHENSYDIDHNLPDHDIDQNKISKSQPKTIVSHQILNRFKAIEHLLLVDNESAQENDTGSKQRV